MDRKARSRRDVLAAADDRYSSAGRHLLSHPLHRGLIATRRRSRRFAGRVL